MKLRDELKKSVQVGIWMVFLTLPLMVIKVNTINEEIEWRWLRLILVALGAMVLSFLWRWALARKEQGAVRDKKPLYEWFGLTREQIKNPRVLISGVIALGLLAVVFPFVSSLYQTSIMVSALMYVLLGLGLNIVVGLGGLLHLGYVAFFAVGAYSYALLNHHFGINFWICLPIGAGLATLFGILLGIPVLRMRGDYLAIVTLAFGEIVRIVLENWNDFSFGPSGISNIPRPGLLGIKLSLPQATIYIYFLMLLLVILTVFVVYRLENSRLGRAWVAMREDEIASQAMGINITRAKVTSFALGATWAGLAGVMFAAKTTFINPASFTIWESIIVLCIVVLGGSGSILGVIIGAFVLILLPEYLRAFSEYRMLIFGAILVVMMVFRPGGIVSSKRKVYRFAKDDGVPAATGSGG